MTNHRARPQDLTRLTTEELSALFGQVTTELTERSPLDPAQLINALGELSTSMELIGRSLGAAYAGAWAAPRSPHQRCHRRAPASEPSPRLSGDRHHSMTMHGLREDKPAEQWTALFRATWMGYRTWYTSQGLASRPDLEACEDALEEYMPELVPIWQRLVNLAGRDPLAARMLSLWNPPAYASGCSQLVIEGPPRVLIRNYDYDPTLFEQVVYSTKFGDRRVIGTADCLWGLLDGMNDDGLVVSLTAGGRPGSGQGFAIPLVIRYLLEVCTSVADVQAVLSRVPVAASYNVTASDASGATATFFVAPNSPPEYFEAPLATNHRGTVPEYPEMAARFNSVERQDTLVSLRDAEADRETVKAAFLEPPLYNTRFSQGFGTLYTVLYYPDEGYLEYTWPDRSWRRYFDSPPGTQQVTLVERGGG
ncbi:MAG: C45 family peptidase [Actinomycetes bacterium]